MAALPVDQAIKVYLLEGFSASQEPVFRFRAARVSSALDSRLLHFGVPFAMGASRVAHGGLYVVIPADSSRHRLQLEAQQLLKELRAAMVPNDLRASLNRLSSMVSEEVFASNRRSRVWSAMMVEFALSLPATDPYSDGRATLGDRFIQELLPGMVSADRLIDRGQSLSIQRRIFGDLSYFLEVAAWGQSSKAPLVPFVADQDLVDELTARREDRLVALNAAAQIAEGEARMFVMLALSAPMVSGKLLLDIAVEAVQNLFQFLFAVKEAELADASVEWDRGVLRDFVFVFIPIGRNIRKLGPVVSLVELLNASWELISLILVALSEIVAGLRRWLDAQEADCSDYFECDETFGYLLPCEDFVLES